MGFTFSLKMVMKRLSVEGGRKVVLGPEKLFLLGGCRPPDPLLFLGGFQPPRPPGGGLQPPVPPCIPRGSASRALRFFLVPRSWKPLTCGYVAAVVFL